jgi:pilus assembly protein Flp/PilA
MTYLKNFIQDEEGQDLVEYALLLGFIALAATAALTSLETNISTLYSKVGASVAAG